MNTFTLPRPSKKIKSLAELHDGVIISQILNDIDAKYFRDGIVKTSPNAAYVNWVQRFNACTRPSTCIALNRSPLFGLLLILTRLFFCLVKKLSRNMTDYYGDVLRASAPNVPPDEMPNLSSIAKERSIPDIVKFLRLVLALAVKSDKKEHYVQKIYTLSPETQKSLMYLLQQVRAILFRIESRSSRHRHQEIFQAMDY